jgi:hypothetical protein
MIELIIRLYSQMKQLLPSEEIYEDYLHPSLFWGTIFCFFKICCSGPGD